ncbi:MAG: hypothetical protein ACJ8GN_05575 [Longimicrobiaceae bacterium]
MISGSSRFPVILFSHGHAGGKGTTSKAIRFQLRPDPLARQEQWVGPIVESR